MRRTQFTQESFRTAPIPFHPEDQFIIAKKGDRFDQIAHRYYGDQRAWWILRTANPDSFGLFPTAGTQIRIPSNRDNRLFTFFDTLN